MVPNEVYIQKTSMVDVGYANVCAGEGTIKLVMAFFKNLHAYFYFWLSRDFNLHYCTYGVGLLDIEKTLSTYEDEHDKEIGP